MKLISILFKIVFLGIKNIFSGSEEYEVCVNFKSADSDLFNSLIGSSVNIDSRLRRSIKNVHLSEITFTQPNQTIEVKKIFELFPNLKKVFIQINDFLKKGLFESIHTIKSISNQELVLQYYFELPLLTNTIDSSFVSNIKRLTQDYNFEFCVDVNQNNFKYLEASLHEFAKIDLNVKFYISHDFLSNKDVKEDTKYVISIFYNKLLFLYEKDEATRKMYIRYINTLTPHKISKNYRVQAFDVIGDIVRGVRLIPLAKTEDSFGEVLARYSDALWYKVLVVKNESYLRLFSKVLSFLKSKPNSTQIMIVGWYGTETVGDKAILAGIISKYKELYPNSSFVVASVYPFVTIKTMRELETEALVVNARNFQFLDKLVTSNIVIMGGGPLMDLPLLPIPLLAFSIGKSLGKKTIVEGCGIGPLLNNRYREMVKKILKDSSEIYLRDSKSTEIANGWAPEKQPSTIGDPSVTFLNTLKRHYSKNEKRKVIACYLREWTSEYNTGLDNEEFYKRRKMLESSVAKYLIYLATKYNVGLEFYSMHNFVVGNDDRDFYRRFMDEYFSESEIPIYLEEELSTVQTIVNSMVNTQYSVCMRFHSVVFASTLGCDFKAIDYTSGGKIKGYLSDHNEQSRLISIQELIDFDESNADKYNF
jgi:polysaccharide pyruvyl transferase WcaK-like protein